MGLLLRGGGWQDEGAPELSYRSQRRDQLRSRAWELGAPVVQLMPGRGGSRWKKAVGIGQARQGKRHAADTCPWQA